MNKKLTPWWETYKAELAKVGVSQQEVAVLLGVSLAAVNRWLSGKSKPDIYIGIRLARLIGTDCESLYGGNIKQQSPKELVRSMELLMKRLQGEKED